MPLGVKILEKYSPTKNISNFRWVVSINQGAEQIYWQKGGISKELDMHLARHTFTTTVTLAKGIPIETVCRMLGHTNIKQTQHDAKVTPLKIKNDMADLRVKRKIFFCVSRSHAI